MLRSALRAPRKIYSAQILQATRMSSSWNPRETPYPHIERDESIKRTYKSKLHGEVTIPDPYAALEDPEAEVTKSYVKRQAEFTEAYLAQHDDIRQKFKRELTANFDYPRFSAPAIKGDGRAYFSWNTGLQAQSPIYRVNASELDSASTEKAELWFDPNLLSTDGTAALSSTAFSKSGKYYAYGVSQRGSDWYTIYVRETSSPHDPSQAKGEDKGRLPEVVKNVKFSGITWMPDDSGFFYGRFVTNVDESKAGTETESNVNQKMYFHRLGTSQEEDVMVIEDKENDKSPNMYGLSITRDGSYLCVTTSRDTGKKNLLKVADLRNQTIGPDMEYQELVTEWAASYYVIDNASEGSSLLYLQTNKNAPKEKVVTFDLANPDQGFKDHIAEDPNAVLASASIHNQDKLILIYSRDVKDEIYLHNLKSGDRLERIGADLIGTVGGLSGRREDDQLFFTFSNFVSPGQTYRYQFNKAQGERLSLYRESKVKGINSDDFVTEQVFYESKDGTKIPMFLVYPKGLKRDGTPPAILYGYGGFSISLDPAFSPSWMTFIKNFGGVLAVPNIRGGGEYGEDWHEAGTLDRKQNVFDDFQAAAKYLLSEQIAGKICISGGSNGGLLVAACINQAPELFSCAVADVGVMDMLRFHLFTIGRAWTADYGNPDDAEAFDYLIKYSPLHNVKNTQVYPSTMLLTGDHDDRVVPLHSLKLAAELQTVCKDNPNPLLLRMDLASGHGAGKSTEKRIAEASDKWAFVAASQGLEWVGQE